MENEVKLIFISKLTTDPTIPLRPLVDELGVSYATLFNWRKEYNELQEQGRQDNVLITAADIKAVTKSVTKLSDQELLSTATLSTALAIVNTSANMLNRSMIEPRDMLILANAITAIQNAFFPKSVGNINIIQDNSSSGLSQFKGALRD